MSEDDLSYKSGLLFGRLIDTDDSDGAVRIVPGVHFRWRLSEVLGYHQMEPSVLHLYVRGQAEPFEVLGQVADLDKILARASLTTVP